MSNKEWFFYIIYNNNFTYAGVSPDPKRRLKQHNGEMSGGAKYTTSKGTEWAVKHVPPINSGGIKNRINKLFFVLNKDKWTSKAPLASNIPLNILWMNNEKTNHHLPDYITQKFNCSI